MKNLVYYINESRLGELAEKNAEKLIEKYTDNKRISAFKFRTNAEKDGWVFDENYNNWSAGESITILFTRKKEKLYVEYVLGKNSTYNGILTDDILNTLDMIDHGEYYSK